MKQLASAASSLRCGALRGVGQAQLARGALPAACASFSTLLRGAIGGGDSPTWVARAEAFTRIAPDSPSILLLAELHLARAVEVAPDDLEVTRRKQKRERKPVYCAGALHCTALHCTAPHCAAPRRAAPRRTAPHRTGLDWTGLDCMQYRSTAATIAREPV